MLLWSSREYLNANINVAYGNFESTSLNELIFRENSIGELFSLCPKMKKVFNVDSSDIYLMLLLNILGLLSARADTPSNKGSQIRITLMILDVFQSLWHQSSPFENISREQWPTFIRMTNLCGHSIVHVQAIP